MSEKNGKGYPGENAPQLDQASSAEDVDQLAQYLYGAALAKWATGVLHPTSVWRGPDGDFQQALTLRIGEQTPTSSWDLFALSLARARADAILTSGRILRLEPHLHHGLLGPATLPRALADWRLLAGKDRPPVSLVMTRSGELDFNHPFFSGPGRVVIYTGAAGAWRLESRAADAGVEVEAVAEPTTRGALEFVRGTFGCATISIEAGPSIARELYEPPIAIDEVLLSTYLGKKLPTSARGGRQISREELEYSFDRPSPPRIVRADIVNAEADQGDPQNGGGWCFEHFLRSR